MKLNESLQTAFCIYSDYLCLILQFDVSKKRRNQEGGKEFFTSEEDP